MVGLGDPVSDRPLAASTRAREAYFLDFAKSVRPLVQMPLMITGGMRSAAAMNEALAALMRYKEHEVGAAAAWSRP
ncbi:MAG: hypothetical protein ACT4PG_02940 [Panacagrimonas sp.]